MDPLGLHGHVAFRVDIGVEGPPCGQEVLDFQGGQFDEAMAQVRLEAGGLGVQDDLAGHSVGMPCFAAGFNPRGASAGM